MFSLAPPTLPDPAPSAPTPAPAALTASRARICALRSSRRASARSIASLRLAANAAIHGTSALASVHIFCAEAHPRERHGCQTRSPLAHTRLCQARPHPTCDFGAALLPAASERAAASSPARREALR